MMKVVLFALVCVSVSQVYGAGIEDEIKEAVKHVDEVNQIVINRYTAVKNRSDEIRETLVSREEIYMNKIVGCYQKSIEDLQHMHKVVSKIAENNKLSDAVFKCIDREEQLANHIIGAIGASTHRKVKKRVAGNIDIHNSYATELSKLDNSRSAIYKQGVADLKKCKDSASVKKTAAKTETDLMGIVTEINEIESKIISNYVSSELGIQSLILISNSKTILEKNKGLKYINDCLKL